MHGRHNIIDLFSCRLEITFGIIDFREKSIRHLDLFFLIHPADTGHTRRIHYLTDLLQFVSGSGLSCNLQSLQIPHRLVGFFLFIFIPDGNLIFIGSLFESQAR